MTRLKQLIFLDPQTGCLTLGRSVPRGACPPPGTWAYVDYNTKCFNTTTTTTTTKRPFPDGIYVICTGSPEGQKLYIYYHLTNSLTEITLPAPGAIYRYGVAITDNKLWMFGTQPFPSVDCRIYEWDITLSPFAATYNHSVDVVATLPNLYPAQLGTSLNGTSTEILTTNYYSNVFYQIDVNTGAKTEKYTTSPDFSFYDALIATTTGKLLTGVFGTMPDGGGGNFFNQYDATTGNLEVSVPFSSIEVIFGVYEYDGEIFFLAYDNSTLPTIVKKYNISKTAPYTIAFVENVPLSNADYSTSSMSQPPEYVTAQLIV